MKLNLSKRFNRNKRLNECPLSYGYYINPPKPINVQKIREHLDDDECEECDLHHPQVSLTIVTQKLLSTKDPTYLNRSWLKTFKFAANIIGPQYISEFIVHTNSNYDTMYFKFGSGWASYNAGTGEILQKIKTSTKSIHVFPMEFPAEPRNFADTHQSLGICWKHGDKVRDDIPFKKNKKYIQYYDNDIRNEHTTEEYRKMTVELGAEWFGIKNYKINEAHFCLSWTFMVFLFCILLINKKGAEYLTPDKLHRKIKKYHKRLRESGNFIKPRNERKRKRELDLGNDNNSKKRRL